MNERKRTNLKALFIILATALILAFVYLAVPKERGIERRVDATLVQNGSPAERRQTALTISGTYKSSLFGGDSFAGKVEIDCLPVTAGELLNVVFSAEDKGYGLSYVGINDMNNAVDVGIIPADHAAAAAFVQADAALSGLPLCVTAAERLSQLGGESPAAMPQAGGGAVIPLAAALLICGAILGAAALKRKR